MRSSQLRALVVLVAAVLGAGACSAAAQAPAASQPSPAPRTMWLRLATTQAIPPANAFAVGPVVVIRSDGAYVTPGPVREIYPGPLVPPLSARTIAAAGMTGILDEARRLGLLAGPSGFSGGVTPPGAVTGRIELTVDGRLVTLTGDPGRQVNCIGPACQPAAGSAEAFATFWQELQQPAAWLADAIGPETAFAPSGYAILVGPPPAADRALGARIADWPLAQSLATFGSPVANGTMRCGTVTGVDADVLRPALAAADQLTQWTQDPATRAAFGLTVRPLIADEDPCAEMFGAR